jgi:hypothetical protein
MSRFLTLYGLFTFTVTYLINADTDFYMCVCVLREYLHVLNKEQDDAYEQVNPNKYQQIF